MTIRALALAATAFFAGNIASIGDSAAENLYWEFQNRSGYSLQLSFYSQRRNAEWPGNNRAYDLNSSRVRSFNLNCIPGEKICYGAWYRNNPGQHWGVGRDGKQGCRKCCYDCGDATSQTNLDP